MNTQVVSSATRPASVGVGRFEPKALSKESPVACGARRRWSVPSRGPSCPVGLHCSFCESVRRAGKHQCRGRTRATLFGAQPNQRLKLAGDKREGVLRLLPRRGPPRDPACTACGARLQRFCRQLSLCWSDPAPKPSHTPSAAAFVSVRLHRAALVPEPSAPRLDQRLEPRIAKEWGEVRVCMSVRVLGGVGECS